MAPDARSARADWSRARRWRARFGAAVLRFGDDKPRTRLIRRAEYEVAGWQLEGRLARGKLWEEPGDSNGLYAWELVAARDIAPRLRLRPYAGGSDGSAFLQGTGSGYTRNYLGASLLWFH